MSWVGFSKRVNFHDLKNPWSKLFFFVPDTCGSEPSFFPREITINGSIQVLSERQYVKNPEKNPIADKNDSKKSLRSGSFLKS
jgi:hypothetical protein